MHRNTPRSTSPPAPRSQPRARQPYAVKHDFDGSAELTTTLAHAISDATGTTMTDAECSLYDYLDRDALNRLFDPADDGAGGVAGQLSFVVLGHRATVYSNGQIYVSPLENAHRPH